MNILFLLSGSEPTGSWTYSRSLAREWEGRHRVFWVNDRLEDMPGLTLPMSKKLFPIGIQNAWQVASFAKKNRIHILHAHSRRANVVAALASQFSGIPYVTTAHMRMSPHFFNRLMPCWGQKTMAISEVVAEHLLRTLKLRSQNVTLIRNGIDLEHFSPLISTDPEATRRITILGRLSGNRLRTVRFLLSLMPKVMAAFPRALVQFVGHVEPRFAELFRNTLDQLNGESLSPRVTSLGYMAGVRPLLAESAVVLASGRSAMEAMAMGIPVIAIGEKCSVGLVTSTTIDAAKAGNFGDFPFKNYTDFNPRHILDGLETIFKAAQIGDLGRWSRRMMETHYNLKSIAPQIENVYKWLISRS